MMGERLHPLCKCCQCRAPRLEYVEVTIRNKETKTELHTLDNKVGSPAVLNWVANQAAAMGVKPSDYEIRIGKKGPWIS